jgi:1,2-diacylglycerol 3-alpha-glucosyltransferase
MKIAIFSDSFFPMINGVTIYISTLTNKLSELEHEVFLFVPYSKNKTYCKRILNRKIHIYYIKGVKAFFYPEFKVTSIITTQDINVLKKINPDIIYFQTPFTIGLKAIIAAKILKKPLIGIFHTHIASDEYLSNLGRLSKKINLKPVAWAYLKQFYNRCDVIISPSKFIKRTLLKNGIKKPVTVVNNFIDDEKLANKKSYIKIRKNSFIYFGRISLEKNLKCLINAFMKLTQKRKDTHLYIFGTGPLINDLKADIIKKRLEKNVFIMGSIDNKIILETNFLKKFLAFVTTSNSEVQPLTIIEAMSKNLPIIGPNAAGITELISSNGIIIPKNSSEAMSKAMLKILENKNIRKKMSRISGEIFLERYLANKSVNLTVTIFNKTIKKKT